MRTLITATLVAGLTVLTGSTALAQSLDLEVLPPDTIEYDVQQDLRVNYSFTGADATNTVVVVDPPQGVIVADASAPAGWTISCASNPDTNLPSYYRQFRWRCTFSIASVIVPLGGGVNGQLSVRVVTARHHDPEGQRSFVYNATGSINGGSSVQASASRNATPSAAAARRYSSGHGVFGTFESPDGVVGSDLLLYAGPWNDGKARIAENSELRIAFPDPGVRYVATPSLSNFPNVSPARVLVGPAQPSGTRSRASPLSTRLRSE